MHLEKRVLVSGGAGFLGSHLCEQLLAKGQHVLCVDNFFTGTRRNIEHLLDHKRFELLRHEVTHPLRAKRLSDLTRTPSRLATSRQHNGGLSEAEN